MTDSKRWLFLFFTCTAIFGGQWIVDETGILASRFSGRSPACLQNNGTDSTCLGMTDAQFNALYVVHYWAGSLVAFFSGFLIAKYGVWKCSVATAIALLIGMLMYTVGPYCSTTSAAFAVMLVGKLLYGCGFWGNVVVSHQVKSHWFFGKEISVAFACHSCSSRLSSIIAYASIGAIVEKYGMQNTMWIVFGYCLIGPVCAIIAGWVYVRYAEVSMDSFVLNETRNHRPRLTFELARRLSKHYWAVAAFLFFFYGSVMAVMSDFPKFLMEARGKAETGAGLISGIIADMALFSVILGFVTDRFGWRDVQMFISSALFLFALVGLDAIPGFNAILFCFLVGLSYSVMGACVWSGVVVVTTPSTVGVAMGLSTALQTFGAGFFLLIGGIILDAGNSIDSKWLNFFIMLTSMVAVSLIAALVAWYLDWKTTHRPLRNTLPPREVLTATGVLELSSEESESIPLNYSHTFFITGYEPGSTVHVPMML